MNAIPDSPEDINKNFVGLIFLLSFAYPFKRTHGQFDILLCTEVKILLNFLSSTLLII